MPILDRASSLRTSVLLFALLLVACDSSPTAPRIQDATFAPGLGIDLSAMTQTGTGLYLQDTVVGTGTVATAGSLLQVHYRGWLTDGTLFDSNQPPDDSPLTFFLVPGSMISGFAEGVRGMRVGGTRKLIVPPALGYGNQPQGMIPRNSILVFEVTVVNVVQP